MESALVIKVKYGDTLRRFTARVDEINRLDLDMVGLRQKICSIFGFSADANLVLRYVDEDGDLVTLVDDDDLRDVMRQQLKFLKIEVLMSNDGGAKSTAWSTGSTTPLKSPSVTNPRLGRNTILHEALSKLSLSKAASSTPVVDNIANSILKIGQSVLNSHFQPRDAADTISKTGVPEEHTTSKAKGSQSSYVDSASNSTVHGESANPLRFPVSNPSLSPNADKVDISSPVPDPVRELVSNLLYPNAASSSQLPVNLADLISLVGHSVLNSYCQPHVSTGPFSKNGVPEEPLSGEVRDLQMPSVDLASNATQHVEAENLIRDTASASNANPHCETRTLRMPSVDLASNATQQVETENIIRDVASQHLEAGNVISATTAAEVATVDLNIPPCDPYSSQSTNVNKGPLSSEVPDGDRRKGKMSTVYSSAGKVDSSGTSSSLPGPSNDSSTQNTSLKAGVFFECPFSGSYINSWTPHFGNSQMPPFKRSHPHTEAMTGMFHKGVRCDGCGVYPITGPRFKSKVKENYDLCHICYNEMGNGTDYIRMDRPASARFPRCVYEQSKNFPTLPPHTFKKSSILKHGRPKLDSRFILDVNVLDGTMMAPSTAFTKIWRMRNNGTVAWPKGTKLVWIGGDKFSDSHSVDLEDGVPIEKELDIAVDFIAPRIPGRYTSYWRLATSSGHKFGQRVWVLVQVDASLKDSFYDNSQGLNLNIPLDVSGSEGPLLIDINVRPAEDDTFLQTRIPNAPIQPAEQVDEEPRLELEKEFPINEATFVGPSASAPAASAPVATSLAPSSISYPIIDLSETTPAVPSNQQSSTVDVPSSSVVGTGGINPVEESLLKELEAMGFKQVDLNKEVLRMNEYDLERSIDDLCSDVYGVSEWDPILVELQEMGFRDEEMNKRLLKKNNGSIKRVVMDLIQGE
ncbi:protein NBR1 homolog [Vigna unguiculata]|uniref:Next to BRCA1 n=1 Tax=Vigna unguiculata TaxID=3917 RepID=A0A4D6KXV3_VIGUN|nr:protein NBR1 homolog [Vigna unguiculata]QCD81017.1 Next to BRCA1 [Vigna unguiculata]